MTGLDKKLDKVDVAPDVGATYMGVDTTPPADFKGEVPREEGGLGVSGGEVEAATVAAAAAAAARAICSEWHLPQRNLPATRARSCDCWWQTEQGTDSQHFKHNRKTSAVSPLAITFLHAVNESQFWQFEIDEAAKREDSEDKSSK